MEQTKFYILYKTTCTITGKFYIGVHSTKNLKDGYLGSGKHLNSSLQKHGRENHVREILEFFNSREASLKREAELVNEESIKDPKCMNIQLGGNNGWTKSAQSKNSKKGNDAMRKKLEDPIWRKNFSEKMSNSMKESILSGKFTPFNWKGRQHKEETKSRMKETRATRRPGIGDKNSQFGTCWIHNETEVKKIKKEDLETYLNSNWKKGRKIN
jgi:hypothetical protein